MTNLLVPIVAKMFERDQLPRSKTYLLTSESCYEISSFHDTSDGLFYRAANKISRKPMKASYNKIHWGSQLRIRDIKIRKSIAGYTYDFILNI